MNKAKAKKVHDEVDAAMQKIAKKHGMVFKSANARFGGNDFRTKVEFIEELTGEMAKNPYAALTDAKSIKVFETHAFMYGMKKEDIFMEFTSGGERFVIIGLNPKRFKYPVMAAKVGTSKRFKFPAEQVARALNR